MDSKTSEALEACIEKYERLSTADYDVLVYDRKERLTYETCALCALHASPPTRSSGSTCTGCPVYRRTRLRGCAGTPWERSEDNLPVALSSGEMVFSDVPLHRVLYHLRYGRWSTSDEDRHAICDHVRERCKQEAEFLKRLR